MNSTEPEKIAMLQVAMLRAMDDDWRKAVRDYESLAELFPGDPFILEPYARAQLKVGMREESVKTLVKAARAYRLLGFLRKAVQMDVRIAEQSRSMRVVA